MEDVVSGAGSVIMGSLVNKKSLKKPTTPPAPRVDDGSDNDEQLLIAVGNRKTVRPSTLFFSVLQQNIRDGNEADPKRTAVPRPRAGGNADSVAKHRLRLNQAQPKAGLLLRNRCFDILRKMSVNRDRERR